MYKTEKQLHFDMRSKHQIYADTYVKYKKLDVVSTTHGSEVKIDISTSSKIESFDINHMIHDYLFCDEMYKFKMSNETIRYLILEFETNPTTASIYPKLRKYSLFMNSFKHHLIDIYFICKVVPSWVNKIDLGTQIHFVEFDDHGTLE